MWEYIGWALVIFVVLVIAAVSSSPDTHAAGDDRYLDENGRLQTPGAVDVYRTPRATYADEPDEDPVAQGSMSWNPDTGYWTLSIPEGLPPGSYLVYGTIDVGEEKDDDERS